MYMFDKYGNEVKIGDYVLFNDGHNHKDYDTLDKIGKILWVKEWDMLKIEGQDKELYERRLENLQRLPQTRWALMLLEK